MESGVATLDLIMQARLDFEAPDEQRFPSLRLAREAAEAGGSMPSVDGDLKGGLGSGEGPLIPTSE